LCTRASSHGLRLSCKIPERPDERPSSSSGSASADTTGPRRHGLPRWRVRLRLNGRTRFISVDIGEGTVYISGAGVVRGLGPHSGGPLSRQEAYFFFFAAPTNGFSAA
jgi:hypothetical protein